MPFINEFDVSLAYKKTVTEAFKAFDRSVYLNKPMSPCSMKKLIMINFMSMASDFEVQVSVPTCKCLKKTFGITNECAEDPIPSSIVIDDFTIRCGGSTIDIIWENLSSLVIEVSYTSDFANIEYTTTVTTPSSSGADTWADPDFAPTEVVPEGQDCYMRVTSADGTVISNVVEFVGIDCIANKIEIEESVVDCDGLSIIRFTYDDAVTYRVEISDALNFNTIVYSVDKAGLVPPGEIILTSPDYIPESVLNPLQAYYIRVRSLADSSVSQTISFNAPDCPK